MGNNIEGKAKVWAKQFEGWTAYSIGFSNKNQKGEWITSYLPVKFKAGVQVENGTEINYRGFLTTGEGKDKNYTFIRITEFRMAGDDLAAPQKNEFAKLTEDDIPF